MNLPAQPAGDTTSRAARARLIIILHHSGGVERLRSALELGALFLAGVSLGFILPNATALALAAHPTTAGSASALLGLSQYTIGAVAAPLVGSAGEDTALPMAIIIAVLGGSALLVYLVIVRAIAQRAPGAG